MKKATKAKKGPSVPCTVTITGPLPDGYVPTGEYRYPELTDIVLSPAGAAIELRRILRPEQTRMLNQRYIILRRVLPFHWPTKCALWGATKDSDGKITFWEYAPWLSNTTVATRWNAQRNGVTLTACAWAATGNAPITADHFVNTETPLLNPHYKKNKKDAEE